MTLLHEATEAKKLDTRMVERNIARGRVDHEDLEKALKKLPDDAENAEYISLDTLIADQTDTNS
jgi:hypothetical protein